MKGEFKEFYGREVHIFYKETWSNEEGLIGRAQYSGLSGIIEKDTKDFIFLKNVKHKIVRTPSNESPIIPKYVVAKSLVGGISDYNR